MGVVADNGRTNTWFFGLPVRVPVEQVAVSFVVGLAVYLEPFQSSGGQTCLLKRNPISWC